MEDLQLFVAYKRELLEQKRAAYYKAAKKERKHRRRTKRCGTKSSMKSPLSELTNTIPPLTVKDYTKIADASFISFGQSTPSPSVPDSLYREHQSSRDVAFRFPQATFFFL